MHLIKDFVTSKKLYLNTLLPTSWILCWVIGSNLTMVAMVLMIMDNEGYQKDISHSCFFQLLRDKELASLPNGSHSPTSMLRTTPIWSTTEELSHDSTTSCGLPPMWVPHNLDHYHNTQHTRCGCHASFKIAIITYHEFLVLLDWLCVSTTTCDAMNGKNHDRFHSFFHSLKNCE